MRSGFFGVEGFAQAGDQAREQFIKCLVFLHNIEINVGRDPRNVQHLVQHLAMLGGNAHPGLNGWLAFQRVDDRKHLDRFRPRPENRHNLHSKHLL
mgnify:CR=1 FL=1